MFVARALRPPDGVVILANAGLRSRRQFGKGREFDNVRHYLPSDNSEDIHWKATNCGPLALVSRVQRDSWDEALGPAGPVAGCAFARFAVPQDRYPKAVLMPIRELMTLVQ